LAYDIKDLPDVKLKGKFLVADESFAFMPEDLNSFYTDNLSMIQVRKNDDKSLPEGQFAEYLLNTACNLQVFKDMFASGNNILSKLQLDNKGFYQLTQ